MAFLTELPLPTVQVLGQSYGLDVVRVEALDAGSVNSNFRIEVRSGERFFARIYEEQAVAGAAAEATLLRELEAFGVPVAAPLAQQLDVPPLVMGKPFAVYPWVTGEDLCHARLQPRHCELLGEALARVHNATARLSQIPAGRFDVAGLRARLDFIEANSNAYHADVARIRGALEQCTAERDPTLPRGLIHGDLFRDNVLWQGPQIAALLDFESACEGTFLYDLMVCVLAWCYTDAFDLGRVGALVNGYQRERPLSDGERRAYVNEGALACLRFATTRITDFAMRAELGKPPKRAYQRFLTRLDALNSGVLEHIFR